MGGELILFSFSRTIPGCAHSRGRVSVCISLQAFRGPFRLDFVKAPVERGKCGDNLHTPHPPGDTSNTVSRPHSEAMGGGSSFTPRRPETAEPPTRLPRRLAANCRQRLTGLNGLGGITPARAIYSLSPRLSIYNDITLFSAGGGAPRLMSGILYGFVEPQRLPTEVFPGAEAGDGASRISPPLPVAHGRPRMIGYALSTTLAAHGPGPLFFILFPTGYIPSLSHWPSRHPLLHLPAGIQWHSTRPPIPGPGKCPGIPEHHRGGK